MTIDPRVLAGATALLIAGLLLLLYVYRRRTFILLWAAAWTLMAASMFAATRWYESPKATLAAYGSSQFLAILAALTLVLSADAYRAPVRWRRGYSLFLLSLLIWFVLAPLALSRDAAFIPGYVLTGGALSAAGVAHLALLRHVRLLGATVVGSALVVGGAIYLTIPFATVEAQNAATGGATVLNVVLYVVTGLGMQLMAFEDMTYELRRTNKSLKAAQWELRQMVTTDGLTGCRNRRFFDEIIHKELERHKRYRIPLSFMFVDIDKFKTINDTLGHETGDVVLQQVAGFLIGHLREADYVFRWGGDEFLILISCSETAARIKAEALTKAFAASDETATLPPGVGLSVGCAEVSPETDDVMALVKTADERMYENKRSVRRQKW
jgi:diguanylate cyclase (GGDEF)-like protein